MTKKRPARACEVREYASLKGKVVAVAFTEPVKGCWFRVGRIEEVTATGLTLRYLHRLDGQWQFCLEEVPYEATEAITLWAIEGGKSKLFGLQGLVFVE